MPLAGSVGKTRGVEVLDVVVAGVEDVEDAELELDSGRQPVAQFPVYQRRRDGADAVVLDERV
jgi:hypothetical protein